MKVVMASEYFWPFDYGGSEWSTYYLASELVKYGHEVTIITPNYGTKNQEMWHGLKIIRFPFLKIFKNFEQISPFWHTNIIWVVLSTFYLIKICKSQKVDILHLQGKYFSPSGYIVKLILKIPVILTTRDYQLICNYAFCLWNKKKACNLVEYFTKDYEKFKNEYLNGTLWKIFHPILSIRGRIIRNLYKFFAMKLDLIICISKYQESIYKANDFTNTTVIYNSMDFSRLKNIEIKKNLLFAGRLTPGKGISLLFEALPTIFNRYPGFTLQIVGEGFLKKDLISRSIKDKYKGKIRFIGKISHKKLLEFYSRSIVTIVPSLWPEPFGRVALESISQGTPVVVTNRGGLKEIIGNFNTGIISKANSYDLSKAIIKAIDSNFELRTNIRNQYQKIRERFQKDVTQKYLYSYKKYIQKEIINYRNDKK